MKFKAGDKVKCVSGVYVYVDKGEIYTISSISNSGRLVFRTVKEHTSHEYNPDNFELVEEPTQASVPQFQVGDIVEAFGVRGKVLEIRDDLVYGVIVCFECENNSFQLMFQMNGIYEGWHKAPSLKLIERPLPKEITFESLVQEGDQFNNYIDSEKLNSYTGKKVSVTIKVLEDK